MSTGIVPVQTERVDIDHRFFEQFNNHLQPPFGVIEDQRLNFGEIGHTFVDGRTVQRQEKSLEHITIETIEEIVPDEDATGFDQKIISTRFFDLPETRIESLGCR